MSKSRMLAAAVLVATGTFGAAMAQAQEAQVNWSITIGSPAVFALPAPIFVRPAPVIVQPAVRYERVYQQPSRWDRDGDGIPNRYDHLYNPQWDRDGDGIPNRRDRFDNRRHDRDGDGIPNRHDRH